jgi:hypothetical protein
MYSIIIHHSLLVGYRESLPNYIRVIDIVRPSVRICTLEEINAPVKRLRQIGTTTTTTTSYVSGQ